MALVEGIASLRAHDAVAWLPLTAFGSGAWAWALLVALILAAAEGGSASGDGQACALLHRGGELCADLLDRFFALLKALAVEADRDRGDDAPQPACSERRIPVR